MNKYELRVNNAVIPCEGLNEWSAMKNLGLFEIGDQVEAFWYNQDDKDVLPEVLRAGWIYQVELAYIKRIG